MTPPRLTRATQLSLLLLLLARFALGATYSLVVPIWESYDEDGHFAYVRYLAKYHHLLDPADPEAQAVYENFQPPLYYVLVAPFVLGLDLGPAVPQPERNPFWAQATAGDNYALHPPQLAGADAQVALAVHIARLVGVVLSTLSVLFVFDLARRVWPSRTAAQSGPVWAATLLYAFWPQFLFSGSMVTNDLAVTTFSAGVLALAVQLVTAGFSARRMLALTLLLAAAVLSKLNALALLPVVAAAILVSLARLWRHAPRRSPLPWFMLLALTAVVAGSFGALSLLPYVTGQLQRIELFSRFLANLTGAPRTPSLLLAALPFAFRSFFASFGWGKVNLPSWLYVVWTVAAALAALGLLIGVLRRVQGRYRGPGQGLILLLGLLLISQVAVALALVVALQDIDLAPGRYLLPSLPTVAVLLVEGFRRLLPGRAQRWFWRALGLAVVLLGWSVPLVLLLPTYAIPQPLPNSAGRPAAYTVGASIELLSLHLPASVKPGQTLRVVVCWRAAAPVSENYAVLLQAFGSDGQLHGWLTTYPGRGNFPTRFWSPGVAFCDPYDLRLDLSLPAPGQVSVHLAVLDVAASAGERLPLLTAAGQPVERDTLSLPLRVERARPPAVPDQALDYRFGDELQLQGYSLAVEPATRSVWVSFQWRALRDLTEDYDVFVHLRDQPDHAYAQSDGPPGGAGFPTHLWRQGDVVDATHRLVLPAGSAPPLSLYVGVVLPSQALRLPVRDHAGQPLLNDELLLLDRWALGETWALPGSLAPP